MRWNFALVLRLNRRLFRADEIPDPRVNFRTYENLTWLGAIAVARCKIGGVSYYSEFNSLGVTDESVKNLTTINPDSECAGGCITSFPCRVQPSHDLLHRYRCANCVFLLLVIRLRTSKNCEDCIANEPLDRSVVSKNRLD